MTRWRSIIGLVAVIGVLVHAALAVRHHAVMTAALAAHVELSSAIGVICRGGGRAADDATAGTPALPDPSSSSECPTCQGCGVAVATLPLPATVLLSMWRHGDVHDAGAVQIVLRRLAPRPPSTGPPRHG